MARQEVVARFYKLLDAWVGRHRPGRTGIAPLDMVLTTRRSTQPDVVYISNSRSGIIQERAQGATSIR